MKLMRCFTNCSNFDPGSLFELLSLNLEGDYVFESITVKNTGKRFDGFLIRADNLRPNIFIEIQGYDDLSLY
jgi:hypothetical protein